METINKAPIRARALAADLLVATVGSSLLDHVCGVEADVRTTSSDDAAVVRRVVKFSVESLVPRLSGALV